MTARYPNLVVLHGPEYGDPGIPLRAAGMEPPYGIRGFTDLIERPNPFNEGLVEAIALSDRVFIEADLCMPQLTRTAKLAISAAMTVGPRTRNIWVFAEDGEPTRLIDKVEEVHSA